MFNKWSSHRTVFNLEKVSFGHLVDLWRNSCSNDLGPISCSPLFGSAWSACCNVFCCMDQGPLSSLVAFILIANRFSILVCQVCGGFSEFFVIMSDYYRAGWLHRRILEQGFQQPHHRSRLWTVGITHALMPTKNSFSGFKPACHNNINNNNNKWKNEWINNNNTKAYILHWITLSLSALHNSKKRSKKFRKTNDI